MKKRNLAGLAVAIVGYIYLSGPLINVIAGNSEQSTQDKKSATEDSLTYEERIAIAFEKAHREVVQRHLDRLADPSVDSSSKQYIALSLRDMKLPASEGLPIFTSLMLHESEGVRIEALIALGQYGPKAEPVVPKIIALLENPKTTVYTVAEAQEALSKISPKNLKFANLLVNRIGQEPANGYLAKKTIRALETAGPIARDAIPHLRKYLASTKHTEIQYAAYKAIGRLQNHAKPGVAQLSKVKSAKDLLKNDGFANFRTIQEADSVPQHVKSILHQVCHEDSRRYIQCMAIETTNAIGSGKADHIKAIMDFLATAEGDDYLTELGAQGLDKLDIQDPQSFQVLATALSHKVAQVRYHAAKSLVKFGRNAAPAVATLVEQLEGVNRTTVNWHLGAYLDLARAIGPQASDATGAILKLLPETADYYKGRGRTWVPYIRSYLLITLADIGMPKEALPFVIDLLANADSRLGFTAAAIAAGALGPDAHQAVPILIERGLKKDFGSAPITFESFLLAFSPTNTYTFARIEAIRALGKIGPKAKAAIPILEDLQKQDLDKTKAEAFHTPSFNKALADALKAIKGD